MLAGGIAVARGEPTLQPADLAWAAAAGVCGAVGIVALYHGLAVGRMGIVAPVTGVMAAAIPVVVGTFLQGPPGPWRALGIVLAMVAVFLVSQVPVPDGRPSGLRFGLLAGLGIGLFNVFITRVPEGSVFVPLSVARVADMSLLAAIVVLTRREWRVPRPALPLVLLAGVLDLGGNVFFILAAQSGRLDVAAVLSSLYPVTTIVLAALVLRERLARGHASGIVLALIAIVFIAAG